MNKIISGSLLLIAMQPSMAARFIDQDSIDGTSVTCMEYRCYSNKLGKFLAQDPLKKRYSHYDYSRGNPIKYSDPTGQAFSLASIITEAIAGLGIGATIIITIVSDGAAAPLLEGEVNEITALTSESVASTAEGLSSAANTAGSAVDNTESLANEIVTSVDSSDGMQSAETGSDMNLDSQENDPREMDSDKDAKETDNSFKEKSPEHETDEGYDSEPPDDDGTETKGDENKSEKENNAEKDKEKDSDKDKATDKEPEKKDSLPMRMAKRVIGLIKSGKELIFFGGLSFAPQIYSELKPKPVPQPKPPPKPR
ncbi:hypothetical protein BJAS_P3465 [Bathymodiolus japonicus methanotrophic gill symbiont]|uniref:RHS repeat-associated core domain-containing protein n=1 Tax=Bathymodiolus japonicus methanotrophic gill symbiont TaxID=113269 RepID=UPI001B6032EF|nr:RHS repeat-associated core domain-containing protein [Bathymodiolus japonicus methanotrophic gill symbiont]GFO72928.1 hypothetical protein BJAS_P3465 [Bathymodiolus japonicus methanotrophic gill symbiont]